MARDVFQLILPMSTRCNDVHLMTVIISSQKGSPTALQANWLPR